MKAVWIAMLALLLTGAAGAAELGERRLSFAGFGTLGLLYHDADPLEYRRASSQPRGAQAGELDLETDSLLGLQLDRSWNRALSGLVQLRLRLSDTGDWTPEISRAAMRFRFCRHCIVHVGRLGWEIFPRADSRNVGYSQLALRPSLEVFGFIPTDHFDGFKLGWSHALTNGVLEARAYGGLTQGRVSYPEGLSGDVNDSRLWGGLIDYTHGPWTWRLGSGVLQLDQGTDFGALIATLRESGSAGAARLAASLARDDETILFYNGGLTFDQGPAQIRLFLGRTAIDSQHAPSLDTGLLIGGYRLGRLTPYLSFATVRNRDRTIGTGLPDSPDTAELNTAARLAQSVNRYNQDSWTLGLRFDFAPGWAFKAQIDRVFIEDSVLVLDTRPAPRAETALTVLGLGLDFVF